MLKGFNTISKSILIVLIVLMISITFETFQQLYYVKRYNIYDGATFFGILKPQVISWVVWLLISIILIQYLKHYTTSKLTLRSLLKFSIIVLFFVFLSILVNASCQLLISENTFSFSLLIQEYLPFYTFQKIPIYTLGYIAITIISKLYLSNETLNVKVQLLSELKETHLKMYERLHSKIGDKASVLNIKIGNKRKIIPVETIVWIEADDYCVKVHTTKSNAYSMRSSLKKLQEKLGSNFLRVHRKAIVNMTLVKEINLANSELLLTNDTIIPISKANFKLVKQYSI